MQKIVLTTAIMAALALASCDDGKDGAPGATGLAGSNGLNSLIKQTSLAAGDQNCPGGGAQIDSGLDSNNDGTLQSNEVTQTSYNCLPGRTSLSPADISTSTTNPLFQQAKVRLDDVKQAQKDIQNQRGAAKNVILFVGDGMGISTVTAARILDGQNKGMLGEENRLSFGTFPFTGLAKTYNVNAQTPDSAGTMTAMMTGVKTDIGVLGVDEDVKRGDCSTVEGNELVTAFELAELAGMSTGLISTARITHATPAAAYAKSANRSWEDISDMPSSALSCEDIASQLINFEANLEAKFKGYDVNGIEVVMGGGRRHFLPKDEAFNSPDAVSSREGDRTDNRDLTAEWKTQYPNGQYIFDQAGFDQLSGTEERVFALFNESHMQYEADRGNDIAGEPSIAEMTGKALDILDNNEAGFFLIVEAGRIDHAHHAGNAAGALTDTIAFADAVQTAIDKTDPKDTLIVVTADHGHVFTIAGYPKRGNPILGKVVNVGATIPANAADGKPYTTLGYMNGQGFADLMVETDSGAISRAGGVIGRQDLTNINTETPGYHQEALIPMGSETHSGEDIGIYATGPGAHLVTGTREQNAIFHVINYAADLQGRTQ